MASVALCDIVRALNCLETDGNSQDLDFISSLQTSTITRYIYLEHGRRRR